MRCISAIYVMSADEKIRYLMMVGVFEPGNEVHQLHLGVLNQIGHDEQ